MKVNHPDIIQLYSLATPNGQKVGIALEAMQLPYEAHTIDITQDVQFEDWFVKINPNSKIPAIQDPNGPNGHSISIMESGAILVYLAEKTGLFLAQDPVLKNQTLQWLFFQVGHIGPMFGQFGHFYVYAKDKCDHPYPVERYRKETERLLGVLDKQLQQHRFIVGDEFSIADMAIFPWVITLDTFYEAGDLLNLKSYTSVTQWIKNCHQQPGVEKGLKVCPFPE